MKIKDILEKDDTQLIDELREKQKHLFDLRTQAVTEKLEDPTQLSKARRDVARIKTVQRQRQLTQARKEPSETAK